MFFSKFFEPKPFNSGYLAEKDGHRVYFMEVGNPKGEPVLFFHGGPGGEAKARHTKCLDLKKYRAILFDQRGCGKSLPEGQWNKNTTDDLIDDTIRLLEHLNVQDKLILRGASWGSTLALKFAIKYPEKVKMLLLSQIFLGNNEDKEWIEEHSSHFYPDIWEKITSFVPSSDTVPEYYAGLISSGQRKKQEKALTYYGAYERLLGSLDPKFEPKEADEKSLAAARIYFNYTNKRFYMKEDEIIKNIRKISNIPALIVHNRLDFVCPLKGAYRLHKSMPNSKLVIVPEKGHVGKLLYKTIKKEIRDFCRSQKV